MMNLEIAADEHRGRAEAKVYEAAGGYAPTVGIIGAVLGLIQVMKHLDQIELGRARDRGRLRRDGIRSRLSQHFFPAGRR